MESRISPPKPHYIPGYTGHCPRYSYIQNQQGVPHQYCIDFTSKELSPLCNKQDSSDSEEHKLTFNEIDYVMAHERDPKYVRPSEPGPESFLKHLNEQLGAKTSHQLVKSVFSRQKQIESTNLARKLAYRLEGVRQRSADTPQKRNTKEDKCRQIVFKTRDMFEEYKAHEAVEDKNTSDSKNVVQFCKAPLGSPTHKFVSNRKHVFDIYKPEIGLTPNYGGHVPGFIFKFGTTFGNGTYNARQWLRKSSMR